MLTYLLLIFSGWKKVYFRKGVWYCELEAGYQVAFKQTA